MLIKSNRLNSWLVLGLFEMEFFDITNMKRKKSTTTMVHMGHRLNLSWDRKRKDEKKEKSIHHFWWLVYLWCECFYIDTISSCRNYPSWFFVCVVSSFFMILFFFMFLSCTSLALVDNVTHWKLFAWEMTKVSFVAHFQNEKRKVSRWS